jgi:2-polyprenyl-6-methoxyphenol hydroxylase-like FAD-dependent oxidoreductase
VEERDDVGFVYYARHFRSPDGELPPLLGPFLQHYDSIVIVTLPADAGTWSVVVCADSADAQLRCLKDRDRWEAVVRAYPLAAHWTHAKPISGVDVMAKIEDVRRHYVIDGRPVVTGLLPLGDAWVATNPTLGRGVSIGALQAVAIRDALRSTGTDDRVGLVHAWSQLVDERVEGHVADTIAVSRHRLTQLRAERRGCSYRTDDPVWNLGEAVTAAASRDQDLFRHMLGTINLLHRDSDIVDNPELAERAVALADPTPLPGPDRQQLLALARSAPA